MLRRVVITGVGMITPAGIGRDSFDQYLEKGKQCIGTITSFDKKSCPVKVAGEVKDFIAEDFISKRIAKRCDRFSHLALVAADEAVKNAGWDFDSFDSARIGVILGNNLGGWEFGERGLYELYRQGEKSVNPYQASAWFPAAAQGQISIRYGLKGYSKTVVADRASGLAALALAVRTIEMNHVDMLLAGGAEAPVAPYAMLCYLSAGGMSLSEDPEMAFLPFDQRRNGLVIAEGSVILALEERNHALQRGASILGEINSYGINNNSQINADPNNKMGMVLAMKKVLRNTGWQAKDIDYVCADGSGLLDEDQIESLAIKEVLGSDACHIPVSVPKAGIGHMLGAAGPADVYSALHAINHRKIINTVGYQQRDSNCDLNIITKSRQEVPIRKVLVNAQGRGGVSVCLGISASE